MSGPGCKRISPCGLWVVCCCCCLKESHPLKCRCAYSASLYRGGRTLRGLASCLSARGMCPFPTRAGRRAEGIPSHSFQAAFPGYTSTGQAWERQTYPDGTCQGLDRHHLGPPEALVRGHIPGCPELQRRIREETPESTPGASGDADAHIWGPSVRGSLQQPGGCGVGGLQGLEPRR